MFIMFPPLKWYFCDLTFSMSNKVFYPYFIGKAVWMNVAIHKSIIFHSHMFAISTNLSVIFNGIDITWGDWVLYCYHIAMKFFLF